VGQMFTEDVKEDGRNLFMADTLRVPGEPRRSVVELDDTDIFKAVERYYANSEQRPARLFRHGEEDFVMVSAHPDCDVAWFDALNDETIQKLDQTESMSLLETRRYKWDCGCNERRMMQVLAPIMRQSPEQLYGSEASLRMSCPRCGARYAITREAMEAFIASPAQ
jgi:molecular chaperone Hsp33